MQSKANLTTYKLSKPAEADLAQTLKQGIEIWGITQTIEYADLINDTLELLTKHPQMGRDRSHIKSGIRSFRVESHIVFYREKDNQLEVIRILHKRMDFKSHL